MYEFAMGMLRRTFRPGKCEVQQQEAGEWFEIKNFFTSTLQQIVIRF
jgi:hypothetical protein